MVIEKRFQLSEWNEGSRRKVVEYWADRNVRFMHVSENELVGTRGSLLGNMVSPQMQDVLTTMKVEVTESKECVCVLDIATTFQIITSWNRRYWQLELDTFESFLLRGERRQAEWASYSTRANKADCLTSIAIFVGFLILVGLGVWVVMRFV